MDLKAKFASVVSGEVSDSEIDLRHASRDTSLFTRTPKLVVYPKDTGDVSNVVKAAVSAQEAGTEVSLTGRAAGTDMSGGPLTTSVVVSFTKHMNHVLEVGEGYAITEPGVFYRDFEKATLEKGLILPSYPASREIAALGGIVANNSGGERTLEYGKTEKYLEEVECVLSDGSVVNFKALTTTELEEKKKQKDLEGEIYRKMDALLSKNEELIKERTPKVSKNSAGYALWNIKNPAAGTFNLAKLICGSQGTLALWTKAKLALVKPKEHRAMLVVFLSDINILPDVVHRVLPFHPESFESYDDHTFTLAVRFLPQMLSQMGFIREARLIVYSRA